MRVRLCKGLLIALLSLVSGGLAVAADLSALTLPRDAKASQGIPLQALKSFQGDDLKGKDGPLVRIGLELATLFHEHQAYRASLARGPQPPFKPSHPLIRVRDGTVVIDAVATGANATLMNELVRLGLQHPAQFGHIVSGYMPISALPQVAKLAGLRLARPAYAKAHAGSITSQGDIAQLSDIARTTFGVDGAGVTIGTLSDSYDCLGGAASDVASNDLPAGVVVLQEEIGCASGTDEGRAMMQIIHDVAPGSNQAFHSAFGGTADFASGIVELATVAGASVINDDVIYFAEPMFQDGAIAQAVDQVKAMDVTYFSSAGNYAHQSYEDDFRDSGQPGYFPGSTQHDFNPGTATDTLQRITIPAGSSVTIVLQWENPFFSVSGAPGAATDLDLIVYSSGGAALYGAISDNLGGDAVEVLTVTNSGPQQSFQLGIERFAGPAPGRVKFVWYGTLTINEFATDSSTLYGHANAAGARAVGAARYSQTPAFGVTPPRVENFSSLGGTPILFDTSGTPVSELRQKPEIVAPDGGDNTFFGFDYEANGFPNFFGTSAAAPHAAGVAALIRELDSGASADAVYAAMQTTALDMGAAGFDALTGYGLIQADQALLEFDGDADGINDGLDNCPALANPGQDNNDGDTEGDVCDDDDDNDGLTDVEEMNYDGNPAYNPLTDTNPLLADTDGDGYDDFAEIAGGSDPLVPTSIPGSATGDLNYDGVVDVIDVLRALRILLGLVTPAVDELLRGDVAPVIAGSPAPDGLFNPGDLVIIQRLALGQGFGSP